MIGQTSSGGCGFSRPVGTRGGWKLDGLLRGAKSRLNTDTVGVRDNETDLYAVRGGWKLDGLLRGAKSRLNTDTVGVRDNETDLYAVRVLAPRWDAGIYDRVTQGLRVASSLGWGLTPRWDAGGVETRRTSSGAKSRLNTDTVGETTIRQTSLRVCGIPSERGVGYPERCSGLVCGVRLGHGAD
jgi:hypothetical protein